jgi:uncharacterized damage-inducible protein DinB
MKATELVGFALEGGRAVLEGFVRDIEGDALVASASGEGGSHTLWILGHLTLSESGILHGYMQGGASPLADWQPLFGRGSEPVADASKYPTKEALLKQFREVRGETMTYLATLSEADLDRETSAQRKDLFGTVGRCLGMMVIHQSYHTGQLAVIRKRLGLERKL